MAESKVKVARLDEDAWGVLGELCLSLGLTLGDRRKANEMLIRKFAPLWIAEMERLTSSAPVAAPTGSSAPKLSDSSPAIAGNVLDQLGLSTTES